MMTKEEIECCRRIGRDEAAGRTTIALTELDALCDTALQAANLIKKLDYLESIVDEIQEICEGEAPIGGVGALAGRILDRIEIAHVRFRNYDAVEAMTEREAESKKDKKGDEQRLRRLERRLDVLEAKSGEPVCTCGSCSQVDEQ